MIVVLETEALDNSIGCSLKNKKQNREWTQRLLFKWCLSICECVWPFPVGTHIQHCRKATKERTKVFERSSRGLRCRLTPSWCLKCAARVGGTLTPGLSELQKQRDACPLLCLLPLFPVDVCFGVLIEFASCLRPMWRRRKRRNDDLMFLVVRYVPSVNQPDVQMPACTPTKCTYNLFCYVCDCRWRTRRRRMWNCCENTSWLFTIWMKMSPK